MKEPMKEVEYSDEAGDIIFIDKVPLSVYREIFGELSNVKTAVGKIEE